MGTARDITDEAATIAKAKSAEAILTVAINALDVIFAMWDADDRLVMCNDYFRALNKDVLASCEIGTSFEDHIRAVANNQDWDETDKEAWIAERMERHRNPRRPLKCPGKTTEQSW